MTDTCSRVQGAFYVIEKRVPLFDAALLGKLSQWGAQVSGGDGKIHAHIWIPLDRHSEIIENLEREGFYISQPYERHR